MRIGWGLLLTVGVLGNDVVVCPPSFFMDPLLILMVVVYSHDPGVTHILLVVMKYRCIVSDIGSAYQWSCWMRVPDGPPLDGYAGGKCKMVHMLWSLRVTPSDEYSAATWFGGT